MFNLRRPERKILEMTNLMVWDVPVPSKSRFKQACARNNRTMKDVLLRLMNGYANGWFDAKIPPIKRGG